MYIIKGLKTYSLHNHFVELFREKFSFLHSVLEVSVRRNH